MKNLIILILVLISFESFSAEKATKKTSKSKGATAPELCLNNFLNFINVASTDTSGKFKKVIFSEKTDKELKDAYKKLSEMKDQVNSSSAKALFKKIKPVIEKNAKNELSLCVQMMKSMTAGLKKVCPDLNEKDADFEAKAKSCTETAVKLPEVKEVASAWGQAAQSLLMAK